jgi:hypothetical protein
MVDVSLKPPRKSSLLSTRARWLINGAVVLFCVTGCLFTGVILEYQGVIGMSQPCQSNLRELHQALVAYSADHDEVYPEPSKWMDRLSFNSDRPNFTKKGFSVFRCPRVKEPGYGYALNDRIAGSKRSLGDVAQFPELFDSSNLQWNAHGGIELLPNPSRHHGNSVVFADGHVRRIFPGRPVRQARW